MTLLKFSKKIYQAILITTSYTIFDPDFRNIFFKIFPQDISRDIGITIIVKLFLWEEKLKKENYFYFELTRTILYRTSPTKQPLFSDVPFWYCPTRVPFRPKLLPENFEIPTENFGALK